MIVVLDASAAMAIVFERPPGQRMQEAADQAEHIVVPGIYVPESANALWKHVRFGDLDLAQATESFATALGLPDEYVDDRKLAAAALALACSKARPVYDMLYVVLAQRTSATLLTLDSRLRELAVSCGVSVL
ncbi:MAG: type II toxin-antitoxin system VapC family toxin [Armatimonadetes bacterium]|nr:type II toxin-antitoxin system VapC family toxin [Armatimonadota bacterium]